MSALTFVLPFRPVFDTNNRAIPGAQIWFTLAGTNTPTPVYADSGLTTPLTNPVVANGVGAFPDIYLNTAVSYRVRIYDDGAEAGVDTPLEEYDPYTISGYFSAATRSILAAMPTGGGPIILTESGREGLFIFDASNLSAEVTGDPRQGLYVAPSSDTTGASGAWVRIYTALMPGWFRLPADADDGPSLAAMSAVINAAGRGAIWMFPGKTYWVGTQALNGAAPPQSGGGVHTFSPVTPNPIEIDSCTGPVIIYGNGARIKCLSGKKFGSFNEDGTIRADASPFYGALGIAGFNVATPYAAMVWVHDCSGPVTVKGLELDGNIAAQVIGGPWGDTGRQIMMSGVVLTDNTGPLDIDVWSHHHGLDGGTGDGPGLLSTKENVRIAGAFENNGRQAFSLVGGNAWHFEDAAKFSGTGKDIGAMPYSLPGAGVDAEAEGGKYVVNTTFGAIESVDNSGPALLMVGANTFNITSRDARWIGTTNASLYGPAKGLKIYGGVIAGTMFNLYGSDDLAQTAQFHYTLITNDLALSPTGAIYLAAGAYLSGAADKFFVNTCKIQQTQGGVVVRSFGNVDSCFLHNCAIEDLGVGNFWVSGRFSGSNTSFTGPGVAVPSNSAGGAFVSGGEAEDSYLLNGVRKNATIDKATGKKIFFGSEAVDPASLALGAKSAIGTFAVPGVALGDFIDEASFSLDLAGARLVAWVSAANTVSRYFINENGTDPLDLAAGTVRVKARAQ